ncbi:MAG TPA: type I phosphomannose isomerase catalytic subunit [Candidatus Acidoferrales bacterium]|nr:type I phosphomannose isomerase catalytic subunit [Candidatus Acidoferrales bacterium]
MSSGSASLCPARLEPIFSPRPWGARTLAPLFPEKSNLAEPLGEAWMTGAECRFAWGPFAGKKLGDVWRTLPAAWTGTKIAASAGAFPLLVKFIFADEKLSVQVHPDDEYAARHEQAAGGRGKTEMWYAIQARPGAEVLAGLKPDVTPEIFKRAIEDGSAEGCLQRVPLRGGEAIFVPAGTAHTIGAGLVLCEIQEYSDLTYRVFDYNRRDAQGRSRDLHIEKALQVMRFGAQHGGKIEPARIVRNGVTKTFFIACRYFAAEKWELAADAAAATSPEHFELLIILEGRGSILWGGEPVAYAAAQTWLLPAALGAYHWAPEERTSLLRAYVPVPFDEVARKLAAQGVSEAAMSHLVYP